MQLQAALRANVHEVQQQLSVAAETVSSTYADVCSSKAAAAEVLHGLLEERELLEQQLESFKIPEGERSTCDQLSEHDQAEMDEINRLAQELLENTDYTHEEQALKLQLEQVIAL